METQVQSEVTFYQNGNVTVTQSRYVTHAKTYAMRNISSVHVVELVKSRKLPVIMIVIGLLMMLVSEARVAGLLILGGGIALLFLIKNEFAVRISTNSGELDSVVSKDKMQIQKIVSALNEAIIHRG